MRVLYCDIDGTLNRLDEGDHELRMVARVLAIREASDNQNKILDLEGKFPDIAVQGEILSSSV